MPVKKSGLGKGLDSLIPNKNVKSAKPSVKADEKKAAPKEEILETGPIMVKINKVEPNREQPRKDFDEDALMELADSIKQFGVLQPILVQKKKDYYEIIAGERRWRAAKLAGLKEVPIIVKKFTEQEIVEISLIENIQRENLNPIEEAEGLKSLIEDYNLTQEQAAKRVGKSRAAIANALRLLELPDEVISLVGHKSLSAGHARALLGLNDKTLIPDAAKTIVDHELSVRAAEELIKKLNSKPEPKKNDPVADSYYSSLEQKLTESLGHKVRISRSKRRRSISISYKNSDELEELIRLLGCSEALEDK